MRDKARTYELSQEAIRLRNEGVSVEEISKRLSVCGSMVSAWCMTVPLWMRGKWTSRWSAHREDRVAVNQGYALNERDQAVVERRKHGETLQKIANSYGITRERVRQIAHKNGVRYVRPLKQKLEIPPGKLTWIKMLNEGGHYRCSLCGAWKPVSEMIGGHAGQCKQCARKRMAKLWAEKHSEMLEKNRAYQRQYYRKMKLENPEKLRARARAKYLRRRERKGQKGAEWIVEKYTGGGDPVAGEGGLSDPGENRRGF